MTKLSLTTKVKYNKIMGLESSLQGAQQGDDVTSRCLGITTGQVLEYIGRCMQLPGFQCAIPFDHDDKLKLKLNEMKTRVRLTIHDMKLVGFEEVGDSFIYKPVGIAEVRVVI